MMSDNTELEKALYTAADMQKIGEIPDELTRIINEYADIELTEDELDYVSAASSFPEQSFRRFMEKLDESRKK